MGTFADAVVALLAPYEVRTGLKTREQQQLSLTVQGVPLGCEV